MSPFSRKKMYGGECKSCRTSLGFCRGLLRTNTCPFLHIRLSLAESRTFATQHAALTPVSCSIVPQNPKLSVTRYRDTPWKSFPPQMRFTQVKKRGRYDARGDRMRASIVPRRWAVTGGVVLAMLLLSTPATAVDSEALWALLQSGGQVVIMRHAATEPGVGDPLGSGHLYVRPPLLGSVRARAWLGQ